ncbi:MAG: glycosyltransferase family 2 protein [Actinobacteria bacterium]|nr:glycosyltransferase family 2 protein [Actinomycetota bacterium]
MAELSAVVVTYNAVPYVEPCLESVEGLETIVVDHGSTDGTLDLVRVRFPAATVIEQENRGLAAGWNTGIRATSTKHVVVLNSDAWLTGEAADGLVRFADGVPRAGWIAPRLVNPDGSLQPSVRGFPTPWRLATEYLFLRKLAPRSRLLNGFYGAGFPHDEVREVDFAKAACFLIRREAFDEVGPFDEAFFLFSEETDWCYRARSAGWRTLFFPGAEAVHVGGASWRRESAALFREQVRGHLRFLVKHRGAPAAERARKVILAGLRLRSLVFRGERRDVYRGAADWLAGSSTTALLESKS